MNKNIYAQKIKSMAIFIFLIGNLFYCYEFFVQVAPSAMTNALMSDFTVTATTLGVLSSSFYWSYTFMQIPAGLLLDRYGARIILTLVSFTCAAGTLLFGIAHNVALAEVGRILMGASGAFAFTGVIYLVIRWLPFRTLAMFVGILQAIGCIGAIGGESFLVKLLNVHSWRTIMIALAIIGFAIGIVTWLLLRDKPATFVETLKEEADKPSMMESLKIVIGKTQTWYCALYSFAIWGPIVAFAALWGIPFLMTDAHLSAFAAANGVALIWIGIAISSPLIGYISDRIGKRCILLTISAILGLATTLMIILLPQLPQSILYFLLFLIGIAAGGQTLIFGVVRDNNNTNTTGAANGFNNMAVVLGGIILQPLIGKLLDLFWSGAIVDNVRAYTPHNYRTALLVLPVCFVLAAFMSVFFVKETNCKPVYETVDSSVENEEEEELIPA